MSEIALELEVRDGLRDRPPLQFLRLIEFVAAGNAAPVFRDVMKSANPPPQPKLPRPVGFDVCHCPCWSECENRALGSAALLPGEL